MANENERKHDPAENRRREMGHRWDEAKTGGDEKNVGQTGGSGGATSVGSGGSFGGSEQFLAGGQDQPQAIADEPGSQARSGIDGGVGAGPTLSDENAEDSSFGGRTGSGFSTLGSNTSESDLGSAGAGSGGAGDDRQGSGFIASQGQGSDDYLQEERDEPNQGGFAEQGRGAPDGSDPGGIEGVGERGDNRDSDIEGSSRS